MPKRILQGTVTSDKNDQTITVLVTPTTATLRPTVTVLTPAGAVTATATAAGQKALLQTIALPNGPAGDESMLTAEPRVLADGRTVDEVEPEEEERVVSARTASDLTAMMKNVVREGTGTAAALSGVEVAGKTGTAELNNSGLNQPWFMCFTPDVAIAITLERFQDGFGGIDAAPIAKQVLEALGQ